MIDYLDFDYFDEKELAFTLEPGDGTFKITAVIPGMSKKGNDMLTVTFSVTDSKGKTGFIDDYLVATKGDEAGMKRLATKIKNIAKSINKPEIYGQGKKLTPNDLLGYTGKCLIKTQSSDGFPDKSVIAKYYDATPKEPVAVDDLNDPIPF